MKKSGSQAIRGDADDMALEAREARLLVRFDDVSVTQGNRMICDCEEFELDEEAHRLQFRNVTRKQNLWELLPKEGNIAVWVMGSDGKGGRFHIIGITPGQDDPAKQKPDHWYGTLQRVEAYGAAASL